jgi:hypothetical protein
MLRDTQQRARGEFKMSIFGFLRSATRRAPIREVVMSSALEAIRDHIKTIVADAEAGVTKAKAALAEAELAVSKHSSILTVIEAELARSPTLEEVKAAIEKFGASVAKAV